MPRVLVIDDSKTVAAALAEILAADDLFVEHLEHFIDLGPILRSEPPDLIILDLHMPGLSGLQMGRFIRKYQTAHIPVVIFSAQPEEEARCTADQVGATAVLPKGAPADRVRQVVRAALDGDRQSKGRTP